MLSAYRRFKLWCHYTGHKPTKQETARAVLFGFTIIG